MIAVILHTTFTRFKYVKHTLMSLRNKAPEITSIYVSDTGAITNEKLRFYNELEAHDERVKVFFTGWDTSPAITRNFLVDMVEEPYIWKIDDDFLYDEKLPLKQICDTLEQEEWLGLIGMGVQSAVKHSDFIFNAYRFKKPEGEVIRLLAPKNPAETKNGLNLTYCDVTPDCWIAKRKMFPECAWDEQYHVSEGLHTDFFLHIANNTGWKVAYCANAVVYTFKYDADFKVPDDVRKKSFYNKKRFRNLKNLDKFCKKWNVVGINRW